MRSCLSVCGLSRKLGPSYGPHRVGAVQQRACGISVSASYQTAIGSLKGPCVISNSKRLLSSAWLHQCRFRRPTTDLDGLPRSRKKKSCTVRGSELDNFALGTTREIMRRASFEEMTGQEQQAESRQWRNLLLARLGTPLDDGLLSERALRIWSWKVCSEEAPL